MQKTLKPFQDEGAAFLAARHHALLADEPGLGKTLQAIQAALWVGARSIEVVCPASVRMGWRQELWECIGTTDGWDIYSYNEAVERAHRGKRKKIDVYIPDEVHFLKTVDSQRTQAIFNNDRGLARDAKYIWPLTGTPVLNRPVELYPVMKTVGAHVLDATCDTFGKFTQKFCGAYFDGRGINVRGATNLDDLARRLRGFMLRRTEDDVPGQLPREILKRIPLVLTSADMRGIREVEDAIDDRESFISSARENFSQLGDLSTLLRVTGEAKVRPALAFILDQLKTINKLVVFARHREVISRLRQGIEAAGYGSVKYVGGMSDMAKHLAKQQFIDNPACAVFVGNLQAAGTGINGLQTVCNNVDFVELPWVPDEITQGKRRVRRMGCMANHVRVNILHAPGTIESAVLGVHEAKTAVIDRLMGGSTSWGSA